MADTREQGPPGQAPFDTGPGVRGVNPPVAGDPRSVKVDMGQGPPPVRTRPAPGAARGGGASVLLSALLALICGGAGAWAYERFVPHPAATNPPPGPEPGGQGPEIRKELAGLEDRIKKLADQNGDLAEQYMHLQTRVESLPKSTPAPDLTPIEQKVAQVDRLSQQVEAIGNQVAPLPRRFEQFDRRIAELDRKFDDLRTREATARARTSAGGPDRQVSLAGADRPSPSADGERLPAGEPAGAAETRSSSPADKGEAMDSALGEGAALFREGRYNDAYASFRKLLQLKPEDARVWYYAALSYGLATGDWGQTTRTMAEEGVAREKAGKPARPEIDSAFGGLIVETGKDWLAFYRRRAG